MTAEGAMQVVEQIAVEGPRDVEAMRRAGFDRIIATDGFAMTHATRSKLLRAARGRGLIVLTDPDSAGATIREAIIAAVGRCKHAWLRVDEARRGDRIGAALRICAQSQRALPRPRVGRCVCPWPRRSAGVPPRLPSNDRGC